MILSRENRFGTLQTSRPQMELCVSMAIKKGVFTRQRQPKDIAYKLKERWEKLPLDYKK